MTRKIYKTAMGKDVDLGSLLLQNEHVRAVGNMNVNARGDLLDSTNKVIDQKNRQSQRQYQRTTVSQNLPVHTSSRAAKQAAIEEKIEPIDNTIFDETFASVAEEDIVVAPAAVDLTIIPPTGEGGLAAAIARSRLIKQEKEKTLREKARDQQIRKI